MPIRYSLVARGPVILCTQESGDSAAVSTNFANEAERIVRNVSTVENSKTTYTASDHFFHVVIENGTIFMCATDAQFRKTRAFAFLEEIQSRFTGGSLTVRAVTARPMELQRDFGAVLASNMKKYSADTGDNITRLQAQVEEVRGVMTQNIEKVLEREEKLGDLIEKTGDLEASANSFKKTARAAHKVMWWKNMKMKIILAVVIFVILAVIVVIILVSTGAFKSGDSTAAPIASTTTTPRGGGGK